MIASLPMYDRPSTRAANDRLWAAIRANLPDIPDAPKSLTRGSDPWKDWTHPALLLSQTCGLPFRTKLHEHVQYVATPVQDLHCPPGQYQSVIIAHRSDTRRRLTEFDGARLAVNDPLSQSGWAAPWALAQKLDLSFRVSEITGAHQASLMAVAEGRAELAALDIVTWRMLQRDDPNVRDVREIALTEPSPALPFITAPSQNGDLLYAALEAAIADLDAEDRRRLCLKGVTRLRKADYLALAIPPVPE